MQNVCKKKVCPTLVMMLIAMLCAASISFASNTATPMTIQGNVPISDNIGTSNEVDKFYIQQDFHGSLQSELTFPIEGEYSVNIYYAADNGAFNSLQSANFNTSQNSATGMLTLKADKLRVAPGLYMVEVKRQAYGDHSSKSYQLMVNQKYETEGNYEREFNDAPQSSQAIATNVEYVGNLNSTNDVDYYSFELKQQGFYYIEQHLPVNGDYKVETYIDLGASGLKLLNSTTTSGSGNSVTGVKKSYTMGTRMPMGTYFIKVTRANYGDYTNGDYKLKAVHLEEIKVFYESEFNDTPNTASETFNGLNTRGNIGSSNDIDYYAVNVPQRTTLDVSLEYPVGGDFNVTLYRIADGGSLTKIISQTMYGSSSAVSGSLVKQLDRQTLNPGKYYVAVARASYGDHSANSYNLKPVLGLKVLATPTNTKVKTGTRSLTLGTYNIAGSNFVKLRDFAAVLADTSKRFNIEFNQKSNAINMLTNTAYAPAGGELAASKPGDQKPVIAKGATQLNGKQVAIIPYNINGSTYYNLRDLAALLNVEVQWDAASATMIFK